MKDLISELEQQLADLPIEEKSKNKVDLLNKLCRLLLIENPTRGLELSTTAEKMAREIGCQQGLAYSIGLHGYSKYMMSDLESALPELKTALKIGCKCFTLALKRDTIRKRLYGHQFPVQSNKGEFIAWQHNPVSRAE